MQKEDIAKILEQVRCQQMTLEEALVSLRDLPFEDLGELKIDHHRELRTSVPEVIYGEGKPVDQIRKVLSHILKKKSLAIASRISDEKAQVLRNYFPEGIYHPEARIFSVGERRQYGDRGDCGKIAILTAGASDYGVAEEAAIIAHLLGNEIDRLYDVGVAGLPRLLSVLPRIREASVLIIIAGMEGALPSVVAGLVSKPIIAVPTSIGYGTGLGGLSAMLTMLNSCSPGVTVVNIDNGVGAAVAAHLIHWA